jgi:hypothetical protein
MTNEIGFYCFINKAQTTTSDNVKKAKLRSSRLFSSVKKQDLIYYLCDRTENRSKGKYLTVLIL